MKITTLFFLNRKKGWQFRIVAMVFMLCIFSFELLANPNVIVREVNLDEIITFPEVSKIKGVVTDSLTGEPLSGVTIQVKDRNIGVITDDEGVFEVEASQDEFLQFSIVGYRTKEVLANEVLREGTIRLVRSSEALDQLVVVGYGKMKKSSLTSSVGTLDGEKIRNVAVTNLSNTLGGRISGVIAKQGSGEPGRDHSNIFIRGISTTGNTTPLYVIDGIPRSANDFSEMDPGMVESITVLKDAAAVAPYGVAGANGVILVTTKTGNIGEPSITYHGSIGFQNPTVLPDYVNYYNYARLIDMAAQYAGDPLPFSKSALDKMKNGTDPLAFPNDYVWDAIVNRNSIITNHSLELSGGTKKMNYLLGLGYLFNDGMWKTANNDRFNVSINLSANISNNTKVSFNLIGYEKRYEYPTADYVINGTGRIFELAGYAIPQNGALFIDGKPASYVTAGIFGTGTSTEKGTSINTQLTIEQKLPFLDDLTLKGTISYDPNFRFGKIWRTPMHVISVDTTQVPYKLNDVIFNDPKGELTQSSDRGHQYAYQVQLNYSKNINNHNLGLLGLFEYKENSLETLLLGRRGYDLLIDEINFGSSNPSDWKTQGASSMAKQMGVVFRLNYEFKNKYLFETSGRYDGSYYFAPDKRFGFFPAISAGWRISEEKFMQQFGFLDNLKIRGSYGITGSLAGSPFQYLSNYELWSQAFVLNGEPVLSLKESTEPNPNITWEKARKRDIGLELGILNGLFELEADYFYERRSNMLIAPTVVVPLEYGIGLSQVNGGIMDNRGFEFQINSVKDFNKDLSVGLQSNFTFAKNRVHQIFETSATQENENRRRTGRSLGTQFGYKAIGFFQPEDFDKNGNLDPKIATQPWGKVQPGDIRYQDTNGDGVINENDHVAIGYPIAAPGIIYSFSPRVSYKGISVEAFFQGAAKTNYYYEPGAIMPFWNGMTAYNFNYDFWTPENRDAKFPRLTSSPTDNNTQHSSFFIADASYLRLKTITISYAIPDHIISKVGIKDLLVYFSGQNLITWTDMLYDPELGGNTGWVPSSAWTYPQQKVFSFGLNVKF